MAKKEYISHGGMKLCHAVTGEWLRQGHIMCDKHNVAHVLQGGDSPITSPPSGLVFTNKGSFMPAVVNCKWVEMQQSDEAALITGVEYN